jgi:hypothetical protein
METTVVASSTLNLEAVGYLKSDIRRKTPLKEWILSYFSMLPSVGNAMDGTASINSYQISSRLH